MNKRYKYYIYIAAGIFLLNLSGCSFPMGGGKESTSVEPVQSADREEEIPVAMPDDSQTQENKSPKVLIAQTGYGPSDEKTVYFVSGEDDREFYVVDADTRQTVFTGNMIAANIDDEQDGELFVGDFSSVSAKGSYYIEASAVGRSYTFEITNEHFQTLHDELLEAVKKELQAPTGAFLYQVQTLSWILRYQEFYGEKDSGFSGEMSEWLLKEEEMADHLIEVWDDNETAAENAFYCAAMAQMYDAVKPYDTRTANLYLKEAERIYGQLEKLRYDEDFKMVWLFYDAAVLYKATGNSRYHNVVKNYLKSYENTGLFEENASEEQILQDEAYIYGVVAYLETTKTIDMDLCSTIMEKMLDETREIAVECKGNPYFCVSKDLRNRLLTDRLYMIAVMEHVIVSSEYVQIMEDGIHYIDGCNETGESFVSEGGVLDRSRDEKNSDAALGGAYLFILGEVMESEAER